MYMESRKMVLMKLFAGQQWRHRQREQTCGHNVGGRGWADWQSGFGSVQFSSVVQSCPTLCDPNDCSMPGLPVHHQLPELAQTHVHRVSDNIQPSHPLSSPSPPTLNLSQHQGLFKWVSSSHQVAKVLEYSLDDIFSLSRMKLFWYP